MNTEQIRRLNRVKTVVLNGMERKLKKQKEEGLSIHAGMDDTSMILF
jgi:hypothetical protein